jgi:DNA-binding beta-propeller fold protein YncE
LLVATNKRGKSVSIIDVASGKELARVPTQRRVVHGAVISPDDRYAFISVEGVGSEPGTVEMIDLRTHQRVASIDVGQIARGIDVLRDCIRRCPSARGATVGSMTAAFLAGSVAGVSWPERTDFLVSSRGVPGRSDRPARSRKESQ